MKVLYHFECGPCESLTSTASPGTCSTCAGLQNATLGLPATQRCPLQGQAPSEIEEHVANSVAFHLYRKSQNYVGSVLYILNYTYVYVTIYIYIRT